MIAVMTPGLAAAYVVVGCLILAVLVFIINDIDPKT